MRRNESGSWATYEHVTSTDLEMSWHRTAAPVAWSVLSCVTPLLKCGPVSPDGVTDADAVIFSHPFPASAVAWCRCCRQTQDRRQPVQDCSTAAHSHDSKYQVEILPRTGIYSCSVTTSPSLEVKSIGFSVFVCLSVWLTVCRWAYLNNRMSKLYEIFHARCI